MISLVLLTLQCVLGVRAAPDVTAFDTGRQNQMAVTFSPDGEAAFWVTWNGQWGSRGERRTIVTSRWADGRWTRPSPVPFSSEYDDDDPFVSPDGQWLYFVSTRPPDVDSIACALSRIREGGHTWTRDHESGGWRRDRA